MASITPLLKFILVIVEGTVKGRNHNGKTEKFVYISTENKSLITSDIEGSPKAVENGERN